MFCCGYCRLAYLSDPARVTELTQLILAAMRAQARTP
jgi:hypothetical protein